MVLEFHVRYRKDEQFDRYLFERLMLNEEVMVKGPLGDFVLDEESSRSLIFIAYDTGFAGVKSLIEHAIALELEQDMRLYRIVCSPEDDYLYNVCRSWSDAIDNFYYHPFEHCLPSDCSDEVQAHVCNQLLAMLEYERATQIVDSDIYLSGIEPMIVNLEKTLIDKGIPEKQLKIQRVV